MEALHNPTEEGNQAHCKMFVLHHGTHGASFHIGNFLLAIAFLLPQWFANSRLYLRLLVTLGYLVLSAWAALRTCAPSYFLYNVVILTVNAICLTVLIVKYFPVFIPKHLETVYNKMFRPFRMDKKVM